MAPRSYPTWATRGAVGIYGWPVPVVIAGSLVSALGDPDDRSPMIPLSLDPFGKSTHHTDYLLTQAPTQSC